MRTPTALAAAALPLEPASTEPARAAAGLHLIGDLHGCAGEARWMTDAAALEAWCLRAVREAGLDSVGSLFHSFGAGQGVTGAVVLAESHLTLHTWPAEGYVTLDVYVCSYRRDNGARAEALFQSLVQAFQPADARVQRVARG